MASRSSAILHGSEEFFWILVNRISPTAAFDKCNTTKTAAFRSEGNCETTSLMAFNPPADAPIAITKDLSLDMLLLLQYTCLFILPNMTTSSFRHRSLHLS